jgi:hypothetical protein
LCASRNKKIKYQALLWLGLAYARLIAFALGLIKARRSLKTLRGEYVPSVDERFIADFLYLQDIKYEYEPKYTYLNTPYYPDFFLNDFNVYLEHFAISTSGQPPDLLLKWPFFRGEQASMYAPELDQ